MSRRSDFDALVAALVKTYVLTSKGFRIYSGEIPFGWADARVNGERRIIRISGADRKTSPAPPPIEGPLNP